MKSKREGAQLTKAKMKISSKILNLIRQNESFLVVGHINPEGDSLGASLAFASGLKMIGKKDVTVLSRDPVPKNLKFLPGSKTVRQTPPRKEVDVVFLIDCNMLERTGFEGFKAKKIAIIDHHLLPADAGKSVFYKSVAASYIDAGAAAAGMLVYKVLVALKVPIDKKIATNLYSAILVDTGGFRYSNTSSDALKIAHHLVEAGARPWDISKEIYESIPFNSMKLMGLSLSTLEKKDGIAWINATKAMFRKTGTTSEDSEDFVDFPRKVRDIEVAVFFRQDGARSYKLSLRSKGRVDVQDIAKAFGGGGHFAAAGCNIKGSLKEVQEKVFSALRKAIKKA